LTTPEKRVGADGKVRSAKKKVKKETAADLKEAASDPTTELSSDKSSEPTPEPVDVLSVKDKPETATLPKESVAELPTFETQIDEVIATLDGLLAKRSLPEERVCILDKVSKWVDKQRDKLPPQQTTEERKPSHNLSE
jgi:hypothetical protein